MNLERVHPAPRPIVYFFVYFTLAELVPLEYTYNFIAESEKIKDCILFFKMKVPFT